MAETIQSQSENIQPQPDRVEPQTDIVPDMNTIPRAEHMALLNKEIERLKDLEQKEAKEKERQEQVKLVEQKQIDQEKINAEYLAKPAVDFNPDKKQVAQLKKEVMKHLTVVAERGQETTKGWKKFIPGFKLKEQLKMNQVADTEVQEKLSQFQELVNKLPKESQKDGMAEYLAYVFKSPEEAINLLAGSHRHNGKEWRKGTLAYKSVDHINLGREEPKKPGDARLAYHNAQRMEAQAKRRPEIVRVMQSLETMVGLEPPITTFQEVFGEKRLEQDIETPVAEAA